MATAVATLVAPAFAGGVPPQAMNKTISVSFVATGEAKAPGGLARGFSTQVSVIIYVSSAGRLFFRKRIANGRYSRGKDIAPGEGRGTASFQGNRLIGVVPFEAGARQVTVTFDPSFSSCTASVIEGHDGGGVIRRHGPDGAMYEVTSASTLNPSCSIQSGNAFAG
ncbi:MAG TPA: hypothetical protein VKR55_24270 [Bradyrhizobium sp.]|uniref:hypothetical protein n=1 Tax=Bradyrhizobium sp. TaxID=376 RepID=UPI002D0B4979|nr:hypothetical protein [Bradyrhizobium sp.]HLZ05251.1 hypothetical protein [Bradyrhizobium sp.]